MERLKERDDDSGGKRETRLDRKEGEREGEDRPEGSCRTETDEGESDDRDRRPGNDPKGEKR